MKDESEGQCCQKGTELDLEGRRKGMMGRQQENKGVTG